MPELTYEHYVSELLERYILIAQHEVDFAMHMRQQQLIHLL